MWVPLKGTVLHRSLYHYRAVEEPQHETVPVCFAMSVTLHTTAGDVKAEILCDEVPRSARNFLALCASNAYDDSDFHRAIAGFIVQGGGRGRSHKSRAADAKRLPDEIVSGLTFDAPGVLAFANRGTPADDGVGSQFFATLRKAPELEGTCTIFGKVIYGMDVVDDIAERVLRNESVSITHVTIHANPFADE